VCLAQPRARGGRTFYFTEADVVKQARHRRIHTLAAERRTLRANVEATMKEFKAPCRNGKVRTRGLSALRRYAFLRAIAINFGRVYRHMRRHSTRPGTSAPLRTATHRRWSGLHGLQVSPLHVIAALRRCGSDRIPAFA
jgi:hypothetical protein